MSMGDSVQKFVAFLRVTVFPLRYEVDLRGSRGCVCVLFFLPGLRRRDSVVVVVVVSLR